MDDKVFIWVDGIHIASVSMRDDSQRASKEIAYSPGNGTGLTIVSEKVLANYGGFEVVERYVLGSHPELQNSKIINKNTWSGGTETAYVFERIRPVGCFEVRPKKAAPEVVKEYIDKLLLQFKNSFIKKSDDMENYEKIPFDVMPPF